MKSIKIKFRRCHIEANKKIDFIPARELKPKEI